MHRLINGLILLVFALPLNVDAAGELIFSAGFEQSEAYARFNGFNDVIDVSTAHITGALTLNGGAFPQSQYIYGEFSLRDRVTSDIIPLSASIYPDYEVHVVAGHYDVLYSFVQGDTGVPRNIGAVVMQDVALVKDGTLDIDVTAFVISGRYFHNGGAFPASAYDHGDFLLDGPMTGQVLVGDSNQRSFADVMVMARDYDVRFQSVQSNLVPVNEFGFVNTSVYHNGQLFPVSQYQQGKIL